MSSAIARGSHHLVVASVLAITVGIAAGCAGSPALAGPGCGLQEAGTITESQDFTPYEQMKTKPIDAVIASGPSADVPAQVTVGRDSVDGIARRFTVVALNGAVYSYFSPLEMSSVKRSEFLKAGGLELDQEPDTGAGSFAASLLIQLKDRAIALSVGQYPGALAWGDPDAGGNRPHGLYWFDGKYNYSLIAVRPAEAIVNIGRALVCS